MEAEIRVMQPEAKNGDYPQKPEEARDRFPPRTSKVSVTLLTP